MKLEQAIKVVQSIQNKTALRLGPGHVAVEAMEKLLTLAEGRLMIEDAERLISEIEEGEGEYGEPR